jgi:GT2 family glycosyltransferase
MRVIAVVPTWNARARIGEVLERLCPQVEAVVVVDNGSTDGTADEVAATRPDVTCLANAENRGWPAAVNQGVARALATGAEGVLLVNDDAVFLRGAVADLARALHDEPVVGAASAHMTYRDRPDVLNGAGGTFDRARGHAALRGAGEMDLKQYADRPGVDYPSGAASLLRASTVEDVGPFDESYFLYFEDTDWGLRARQAGWLTVYVPTARVVHIGSAGTADDPARRRYYNVRNRLLLARRYATGRGRARAWWETIVLLARQPPRWLSASRRRDAEAVWYGVRDHLAGRYGRSERFG